MAMGQINLARNKPQEALEYFNKYKPLPYFFLDRHWKGQTYLMLNRYDNAISELENILNSYTTTHVYFGIMYVKTYYYLGLAYEDKGNIRKAVASYQKLIDIWKDADFDFYELREAKKRLDRLIS
jgi:tetratricopeptide (TPR) repeat protein